MPLWLEAGLWGLVSGGALVVGSVAVGSHGAIYCVTTVSELSSTIVNQRQNSLLVNPG